MLYHLYKLKALFSPLNIFQYITFRSAGAFLSALGISLVVGPMVIRMLRSGGVGQTIRAEGPASHHA
jgi:phospho-N-acetylmuramoyl-pentapeptide-transferase